MTFTIEVPQFTTQNLIITYIIISYILGILPARYVFRNTNDTIDGRYFVSFCVFLFSPITGPFHIISRIINLGNK